MGGLEGKLRSEHDGIKGQLCLLLYICRCVEGTHESEGASRPLRHIIAFDDPSTDLTELEVSLRRGEGTGNVKPMVELWRKKPTVPQSFLNGPIDLLKPSSGLVTLEISWDGARDRRNRTQ